MMSHYPSIEQGPVGLYPQPAWPKVIGIISIVWGSLAVACGTCAAGMTLLMDQFMMKMAELAAQSGQSPIPTTPMPGAFLPNAAMMGGAVMGPIGGIILLIAGIMLVRRQASARPMHLAYGGVSLLGTLMTLIGAIIYTNAKAEYIAARPDDEWTKFMVAQAGPAGFELAQAIIAALLSALYPGFILIWFVFVKKTPESMGPRSEEPLV